MAYRARAISATWVILMLALAAPGGAQEPGARGTADGTDVPSAYRSDHVDVYHGSPVPDPYRWMEEMDSPEVREWAAALDREARAFAAAHPDRDPILEAIREVGGVRRFGVPVEAGGRYFHLTFPASGWGPGTAVHVSDGEPGGGKVLVSPDEFDVEQGEGIRWMVPSPDGRLVAYGLVREGTNWIEVRFREVDGGRDLPDRLTGLHAARSSVEWDAVGRGVYYDRFDRPEEGRESTGRLTGQRVRFHALGTSAESDPVIHSPEDSTFLAHALTHDGRWLVVTPSLTSTPGNRVLVRNASRPRSAPRVLVPDEEATWVFVGSEGDRLFFYTDRNAPRGRVMEADLGRPPGEEWRELIPQRDEAITGWLGVSAVGGRITVTYLRDARLEIRVHDTDGTDLGLLPLPYEGSIWTGVQGREDSDEAFFSLSGVVDPGSVFRVDLRTLETDLVFRPDLPYDPADFVTRQVFYRGLDGTRIPMYLVHRRGIEPDGRNPVSMYGYGFGGWSAAPWFQPHMAVFIEMGGVFALPGIRGGGEYGEEWIRAGSRERKPTTIDDYIAATRWLQEEGWTSPGLMVANGSSAGGAVAAAAAIRHPELYGAVVLDFPVLDMLRYAEFTGAAPWVNYYGDPAGREEFRTLLSISPVHTLREGICHPPTLVAPGERDQTTPPLHAYKYVAGLRHAQGCPEPVLMRVSWGAGHSYGADLERSMENWADQLAFLGRVLVEHGWRAEAPVW